jgi:hypothetical protein
VLSLLLSIISIEFFSPLRSTHFSAVSGTHLDRSLDDFRLLSSSSLIYLPLLLLPLQSLNPLIRALHKPHFPLLHQQLSHTHPTKQYTRHKQRRQQMPARLRLPTNPHLRIINGLERFRVIRHLEVSDNVARSLLARAAEHVVWVVPTRPIALAPVVSVVDDLCEDEGDKCYQEGDAAG